MKKIISFWIISFFIISSLVLIPSHVRGDIPTGYTFTFDSTDQNWNTTYTSHYGHNNTGCVVLDNNTEMVNSFINPDIPYDFTYWYKKPSGWSYTGQYLWQFHDSVGGYTILTKINYDYAGDGQITYYSGGSYPATAIHLPYDNNWHEVTINFPDVWGFEVSVDGGAFSTEYYCSLNAGNPTYTYQIDNHNDGSSGIGQMYVDDIIIGTGGGSVPSPPVFTSTPITAINVNKYYSYNITTDVSTFITCEQKPSWLSFNNTTNCLNGTVPNTITNYSVKIKAISTDYLYTIWQNFTINITSYIEFNTPGLQTYYSLYMCFEKLAVNYGLGYFEIDAFPMGYAYADFYIGNTYIYGGNPTHYPLDNHTFNFRGSKSASWQVFAINNTAFIIFTNSYIFVNWWNGTGWQEMANYEKPHDTGNLNVKEIVRDEHRYCLYLMAFKYDQPPYLLYAEAVTYVIHQNHFNNTIQLSYGVEVMNGQCEWPNICGPLSSWQGHTYELLVFESYTLKACYSTILTYDVNDTGYPTIYASGLLVQFDTNGVDAVKCYAPNPSCFILFYHYTAHVYSSVTRSWSNPSEINSYSYPEPFISSDSIAMINYYFFATLNSEDGRINLFGLTSTFVLYRMNQNSSFTTSTYVYMFEGGNLYAGYGTMNGSIYVGHRVYAKILTAPEAIDFIGFPRVGRVPIIVEFIYHYNGDPYTAPSNISWDINNDGIIEGYGPIYFYQYNVSGLYSVTCNASNDLGYMKLTKLKYIDLRAGEILPNDTGVIGPMLPFIIALVFAMFFSLFAVKRFSLVMFLVVLSMCLSTLVWLGGIPEIGLAVSVLIYVAVIYMAYSNRGSVTE